MKMINAHLYFIKLLFALKKYISLFFDIKLIICKNIFNSIELTTFFIIIDKM